MDDARRADDLYGRIAEVQAACRAEPSLDRLQELWALRERAGCAIVAGEIPVQLPRPPELSQARPPGRKLANLPIIEADALTLPILLQAFASRGCLLVRGFAAGEKLARLQRTVIDTYDVYDRLLADIDAGLSVASSVHCLLDDIVRGGGRQTRQFGAIRIHETPLAAFELCEFYADHPALQVIAELLGKRPLVSDTKTVVRKSEPGNTTRAAFHQDGSFLGVAAINVWISLSHAGIDAPGLEVLPQRLERFEPVAGPGTVLSYEVLTETVYAKYGRDSFWCPVFAPGDALIFDHVFLHRTHHVPSMRRDRYALETWFFSPDHPSAHGGSSFFYV